MGFSVRCCFLLQIDNHCLSVGTFCSPSPWDTPEERVPVLMLLSVTPNYSVFSFKPSRLFSTSHLYHISSPLCHQPYFLVVLTGHRHFLCSQHPWLIKHNLSYRNWCLWIENENNGAAGGWGVLCPSCRPVRHTKWTCNKNLKSKLN